MYFHQSLNGSVSNITIEHGTGLFRYLIVGFYLAQEPYHPYESLYSSNWLLFKLYGALFDVYYVIVRYYMMLISHATKSLLCQAAMCSREVSTCVGHLQQLVDLFESAMSMSVIFHLMNSSIHHIILLCSMSIDRVCIKALL